MVAQEASAGRSPDLFPLLFTLGAKANPPDDVGVVPGFELRIAVCTGQTFVGVFLNVTRAQTLTYRFHIKRYTVRE